jgi:hypothetical protein
MTILWDVARCSLVETDRRFRGAHCLHHQGDRRHQKKLNVSDIISKRYEKNLLEHI